VEQKAKSMKMNLVIILRLFVYTLSVLKIYEISNFNIWIIYRGEEFRTELVNLLDEQFKNKIKTYSIAKIKEIEKKCNYPWPLIWQYLEKNRHTNNRKKINSIFRAILIEIAQKVHRQPFIVLFLSILLQFFSDQVWSYLDGAFMLLIIFLELLDILLARSYLGFWDNFRLDFTWKVFNQKKLEEAELPISRVHFLKKFLLGISFYLFTAWIGFASIYYALFIVVGENTFNGVISEEGWPVVQFLYFSLVVGSTAGFGEIHPHTLLAQVCVGCELMLSFTSVVFLFFALSNTFSYDNNLDN
jgi:hypothetical protein